tara:strand:- start:844 stop:1308 length:465 start_codon:yes stop_codon:yes gene_type:complete
MVVSSKFRKMYWVRVSIVLLVGMFFSEQFLELAIMENGKFNFQYAPFWIGIIIGFALIFQFISILSLKTIHVDSKGITIKPLFFNTTKVLLYYAISNIERIKVQQMVRSGKVSDGYHLSALNLIDGKQEIISPDHFENYNEIVNAIRSHLNQQE